jgi:hypothetical protein
MSLKQKDADCSIKTPRTSELHRKCHSILPFYRNWLCIAIPVALTAVSTRYHRMSTDDAISCMGLWDLAEGSPTACPVIREREGDEDEPPVDAAGQHEARQLGAVLDVHEEEHDQDGLDRRDAKRRDYIEGPKVHERNLNGEVRQNQQRGEYRRVGSNGDDVMGHVRCQEVP